MGVTPVNHPPAAVLNTIGVTIHSDDDCKALKLKFDIETRKHRKGGDANEESHHILQDSAMKGLISKYSGHAVMLAAASGGSHDVVNAAQIARNCPPGSGGGAGSATFGELQRDSAKDLQAGLKKKASEDGKPMTDAQAKKLAECLVAEAVKETQARRGEKGKPLIKKSDPVQPVMGCFAIGTVLWLADGAHIRVEDVVPGLPLATEDGMRVVVRTDRCSARLVTIGLAEGDVSLASTHRVRLESGRTVRAAALRVGSRVHTAHGVRRVEHVELGERRVTVVNFGVGQATACHVGAAGLWVELRDLGAPMRDALEIIDVSAGAVCLH